MKFKYPVASGFLSTNNYMNYPFTAIVGQEKLKRALLLCALNPAIGGLLIQGDKGTAKSTAARALAEVVPQITKISHCQFNCSMASPAAICEVCNEEKSEVIKVQVPFVNLPLGATEERVLGSLDLEAVLVEKKKKFQPGLLAAVHQGIFYIDEVNLLPDHLIDILLDVAAMGENIIEREGLSLSHPSRFSLIGTMNPEEGRLRPQFLDRFGLMVHVEAPENVRERAEVVRRRIAFERDPATFVEQWKASQQALQQQLQTAKDLLPEVQLDDTSLMLISKLCTDLGVKSLRADIVMYKTAVTLAALDKRSRATEADVNAAAELVLLHRSTRKASSTASSPQPQKEQYPTQKEENAAQSGKSVEQDQNKSGDQQQGLQELSQQEQDAGKQSQGLAPERAQDDSTNKSYDGLNKENNQAARANEHNNNDTPPDEQDQSADASSDGTVPEQLFEALIPSHIPALPEEKIQAGNDIQAGRRGSTSGFKKGAYIRPEPAKNSSAIALDDTIVHAALRDPEQLAVTLEDLHQKKRSTKVSNLILFIVDASGSMAANKRMEAVKGTVLSLLTDAYQKRDTVGVIAFRGIEAQILLQPTQSIELAEEAMKTLPTGGRTPLPHALQKAIELLMQFDRKNGYNPILVILTDGKANVALSADGDAWSQTLDLASQFKASAIQSLVIDTASNYFNLAKAQELATAIGGQYIQLNHISAEDLTPVIHQIL